MIRLRDVVKDCQFEEPGHIVKFLFLTHNQTPKVREEPLKEADGLNDILGYARLVEGNQHSEHLSKVYLEGVKPSNKTVEAVDKKPTRTRRSSNRADQSNDRIQTQNTGLNPETRKDAVIVVPNIHLGIALHLANNAIIVKRKITSLTCAEAGIIARVMAKGPNPKVQDLVKKTIMS